jgi:acetoin utilization deacetylase AcuC-like enzyme
MSALVTEGANEEETDAVVLAALRRNLACHPLNVPVRLVDLNHHNDRMTSSASTSESDRTSEPGRDAVETSRESRRRRVGLVLPFLVGEGHETDQPTSSSRAAAMLTHGKLAKAGWESLEALTMLDTCRPCAPPGSITSYNAANSANERPCRVIESSSLLISSGLAALCTPLVPRPATDEELALVHSTELVQQLGELSTDTPAELIKKMCCSNYVVLNEHTGEAARFAAGSAVEAVQAVLSDHTDAAVCVVRPPGHHAEVDKFMGFCVANNVAVAAATALSSGRASRVLIVDWDIHHGNGTQKIFADDPRVLFVSIHALYDFPYFSGEEYQQIAAASFTGVGAGVGHTVNVAWTDVGAGDAEYLHAFERVALPIAKKFDPDLVIVSAGFDSGIGDECGYRVTPTGYAKLTVMLQSQLANGKIVFVLEGGYNIPIIAHGIHACVASLLGVVDTSSLESGSNRVAPWAADDVEQTYQAHKHVWNLD